MFLSSDQNLDSQTMFPHSYREGPKCIGFAKPQGRQCHRVIGSAKRADHPRLEEAVKLLLCYQHKATDFDKELEDASQKFRDAAEAAKKAEAVRVKQEKPTPQKPEPDSDSDSESSSESESDGGGDVEIHPLEAWERYNSKWKAIDKSGLEEGLPVVYQVPWPVTSGKQWHVSKEEVVRFFNSIADEHGKAGCRAIFLHERMRWCSRNVKDTFGRMFYQGIWKKEVKMISSVAKEFVKLYSE
ncbi:hypothetical protein FPANT_972 [Fusarium pseudoanthophilum]|uniref:Uncharacterized protein n=1 Tax=Fusarium pseudoanthophilum TaxID=48495 RepID=A0A8H5V3B8_9HYPO|nr:hypothetical protein FPANT_972 [Fusarium pseudoanthophilum]